MSHRLTVLALLAFTAGCSASAQPRSDSAKAPAAPGSAALVIEKKLPATFAAVSNVVELAGGRVAFTDPKERRFVTGDFAAGRVDTLGTPADSGASIPAGGYRLPGWVARLAGDSLALVDFAAIRTTVWTSQGRFARVLALPAVGGATPTLAYDTTGHAYKADLTSVLGGAVPGTRVARDSLPVLRTDLRTGATDTVAHLSGPEFGLATFGEQTQEVAKVFGPTDAFGVTADGHVWVARARTHSVDWRAPDGAWRRGAAHEWAKVAVTDADKQRVMDRLKERGLPQGIHIDFPFAETKPSFELALGAPTGEVWLQYSRANEEEPLRYAVFGSDGSHRRDVTAPAGVQLAGLGAGGAAYGVTKEADGRRGVVRLTPAP